VSPSCHVDPRYTITSQRKKEKRTRKKECRPTLFHPSREKIKKKSKRKKEGNHKSVPFVSCRPTLYHQSPRERNKKKRENIIRRTNKECALEKEKISGIRRVRRR
jgi:hypothetical protein